METRTIGGMEEVPAAAWDALVPADDPFTRHAFLALLEESGSVAPDTGWAPVHLLIHEGAELVGAAPCYLKTHSYGEYIFDWGWVEASHRAGIRYFPKLMVGVPFTPAAGGRLLARSPAVREALVAGLHALADAAEAQSIHVLFCPEETGTALGAHPDWVHRLTHQFHWTNPGVVDFEGWLAGFRARERKKVRRERRHLAELGAQVQMIRGTALTTDHWSQLHHFYRDTVARKHATPYLNPAWWEGARGRLGDLPLAFLATTTEGETLAGALAFQAGAHLYGRYWGCTEGAHQAHFELCYHHPIERCLAAGWTRFEAGAQGMHKIKRGLLPHATHSAHWIRHPGLRHAILDHLAVERRHIEAEIAGLAGHGPFHRADPPAG
jgi:predicted N-acyltransferase